MATYSEEQNHQDSLKLFDMVNSIKQCPLPVIARYIDSLIPLSPQQNESIAQ
jgi:hypothetical protein